MNEMPQSKPNTYVTLADGWKPKIGRNRKPNMVEPDWRSMKTRRRRRRTKMYQSKDAHSNVWLEFLNYCQVGKSLHLMFSLFWLGLHLGCVLLLLMLKMMMMIMGKNVAAVWSSSHQHTQWLVCWFCTQIIANVSNLKTKKFANIVTIFGVDSIIYNVRVLKIEKKNERRCVPVYEFDRQAISFENVDMFAVRNIEFERNFVNFPISQSATRKFWSSAAPWQPNRTTQSIDKFDFESETTKRKVMHKCECKFPQLDVQLVTWSVAR